MKHPVSHFLSKNKFMFMVENLENIGNETKINSDTPVQNGSIKMFIFFQLVARGGIVHCGFVLCVRTHKKHFYMLLRIFHMLNGSQYSFVPYYNVKVKASHNSKEKGSVEREGYIKRKRRKHCYFIGR